MAESSGQPSGAARRRRERRLRSMLRHEQQTVRMALAAALHHSAGPREKVEKQQNGAPRGQKTAARAREGVEHVLYEGLRAQKPPLPGKRPGLPPEPEPRGGAVTVGYVAAPAPPLAVPLLASAAGEAVDHSTLQFLLKHAIEMKKALEEEERRKKVEEAVARLRAKVHAGEPLSASEHAAWYGTSSSSTGKRRKKKKRKRRKLPKAPLPRCGRPCDLQRQFPAALRVLRVPRQNGGHSCSATETGTHRVLLGPGAVLGQGRCVGVVQRQGYGQTVQKTVLAPQLQFIEGRRPPFVPQRQIPMVLLVQKTIETPQLQLVRWLMPQLCRSCHARCRSDRCSWFRHCRKLWRCRRCSSFAVVDVPVICSDKFPASPGGAQTCSSTRCSSSEEG